MNQMELSFNATIVNEPFARTAVVSFISQLNPNMEEIVEIKTIVSEAVANAIIHGYEYNEEKKVYIKVSYNEKRVIQLEIQDFGLGIEDIEQAKQPLFTTKNDEERAGLGLSIIDSYADDCIIQSVLGLGTKLTIKKKLKPVHINCQEKHDVIS